LKPEILFTFEQDRAIEALNTVNEKMAGIFCQPVRKVRFVFLSYIASNRKTAEVLGQCVRVSDFDEVQIKVRHGWQNTAIHELAHVYNPDVEEKRIREITHDVIKYLKLAPTL